MTETDAVVEPLIELDSEDDILPEPDTDTEAVLVLERLCEADPVQVPRALCVVEADGLLLTEPEAVTEPTEDAERDTDTEGVPVVEPDTDLLVEIDLLIVTLTVPVRELVVVAE